MYEQELDRTNNTLLTVAERVEKSNLVFVEISPGFLSVMMSFSDELMMMMTGIGTIDLG